MGDLYSEITEQIVEALEKGVRPWSRPWNGASDMPLRSCGTPYTGINTIVLWSVMAARGYTNPMFMTYKQAQTLGGNVRKGEKSARVVYANYVPERENATGDKSGGFAFLKSYCVFNVEQIDGLPESFYAKPESFTLSESERDTAADQFIAETGAKIEHGGSQAFFAPSLDKIRLPEFAAFKSREDYYCTALHELVHWSGHESRLNRNLSRNRFGDEGYAREELVAEIGAAFLCNRLALTPTLREDHAQYIASWIKVLKNDKRAIFQASAKAQQAADFLAKVDRKESSVEESAAA